MKEFEVFLKKCIEAKNENNSVNYISIDSNERIIVEKLKKEQYIDNVRPIGPKAIGLDLTYAGLHYFDE